MAVERWMVCLLGGLRVRYGNQTLTRFEMRRAGSLLARLAFYRHRGHPREELIEMLWPDEDPESARSRFRQVLTSLRHSLDSLGADSAELLLADRNEVRLAPECVTTDAGDFEATLRSVTRVTSPQERADLLKTALNLYTGELLPGYYEDWVLKERERLQFAATGALTNLASAFAEMGEWESAVEYSSRAVASDPLREDLHRDLIQLYQTMGQPSRALRQYGEMERILWKQLRALPSPELQTLGERLRTTAKPSSVPSSSSSTTPTDTLIGNQEPQTPSLPVPLTRFFGRETEIERLAQMLLPQRPTENPHSNPTALGSRIPDPGPRLLTLIGLGGSGKTRLALEVARCCADAFSGAVWFVPLVSVTDPARIIEAIAGVVCPFATEERDLPRAVNAVLGRQPALLILDNCEQIAESGSPVVRRLLESLPDLRCLVTSRSRLNIAGEQEYSVSPLTVPERTENAWSLERILEFSSVRLFVDRAQMLQPDFALTEKNAEAVVALCRRLEGIPLAIELATTWLEVLSPAQLLERVSGHLSQLASARHDTTEERHQSLWATLEWSYKQLPPGLQQFFRQLSVFQGGWTLEAAEAICTGSSGRTLNYLGQLRRHALIQASEREDGLRFRMLETLREFGREQLTPEEFFLLRQRHADYFIEMGRCASQELTGPDQIEWLDRLETEHDNLRAVLAWCQSPEGDTEAGLRFASSLWRFWDTRGHFAEAHRWLSGLLEKSPDISPAVRAEALAAKGHLGGLREEFAPVIAPLQESLALYRALGDRRNTAWVLGSLAVTLRDNGSPVPIRPMLEECLTIFEECNDTLGKARALGGLSIQARMEGDYKTAYSLLEKSAALYRLCGHKKSVAWCVQTRGQIAAHDGDQDLAYTCYKSSLPLFRALGDVMWVIYTLYGMAIICLRTHRLDLCYEHSLETLTLARTASATTWETRLLIWLGDQDLARGDTAAAVARYHEAILLSDRLDLTRGLYTAFMRLASLARTTGDPDRSLCLLGCAAALGESEELPVPRPIPSAPSINYLLPPEPDSPEALSRAYQRGKTLLRGEAVAFAMEKTQGIGYSA